jgi:hypothetical protein
MSRDTQSRKVDYPKRTCCTGATLPEGCDVDRANMELIIELIYFFRGKPI